MRDPLSARTLVALGAVLVLVSSGCAGPTSVVPSPSAPASTPTPSVMSSFVATPSPNTIAVHDGEPWIAYGWPRDERRPVGDLPDAARRVRRPRDRGRSPGRAQVRGVVTRRLEAGVRGPRHGHPDGSIWTADADGTDAALLSAGGTECPVGLFHPAWSPDGTKLAVVCYPGRRSGVGRGDGPCDRVASSAWPTTPSRTIWIPLRPGRRTARCSRSPSCTGIPPRSFLDRTAWRPCRQRWRGPSAHGPGRVHVPSGLAAGRYRDRHELVRPRQHPVDAERVEPLCDQAGRIRASADHALLGRRSDADRDAELGSRTARGSPCPSSPRPAHRSTSPTCISRSSTRPAGSRCSISSTIAGKYPDVRPTP